MTVFQLSEEPVFPDVQFAEEDGLIAVGGDLSPQRLLNAYSNGIFPWYAENDPILWWSPDPRFVLFPEKFKTTRSFRYLLRQNIFELRIDTQFERVIRFCGEIKRSDQTGTWITDDMKNAYIKLHKLGFAHSIETYRDGHLVGGLYGVSLGKIFFGESMFRLVSDASKFALYHLVEKAKEFGFLLIDSQMETDHLKKAGAEMIPRARYLQILEEALKYQTRGGSWQENP